MFRIEHDIEDRKALATRKDHDSPDWSLSSIEELHKQIEQNRSQFVLDLTELTLVDLDVIRFLGSCEASGVKLVNCSPYIRESMNQEQKV